MDCLDAGLATRISLLVQDEDSLTVSTTSLLVRPLKWSDRAAVAPDTARVQPAVSALQKKTGQAIFLKLKS